MFCRLEKGLPFEVNFIILMMVIIIKKIFKQLIVLNSNSGFNAIVLAEKLTNATKNLCCV